MALSALRRILCCLREEEDKPQPQLLIIPDEHTLLIPPSAETNLYSDPEYAANQRLHERLSTIVRAKEGKMVNLASQLPFNLHNRVLLPEDRTISRSTSGSFDVASRYPFSEHFDDLARTNVPTGYGPSNRFISSRTPSPNPREEESSGSRTRFQNAVTEQPRPTPILNLKLVGYSEPATSRGRTRERGSHPTGLPVASKQASAAEGEAPPPQEGAPIVIKKKPAIVFDDASSLTVSWGD